MGKFISRETGIRLNGLGIYQLLGGLSGAFFTLNYIYQLQLSALLLILYLIILAFFSYGIFCGILCFKVHKSALNFSLVNQFLQLLGFTIFGFQFRYIAGVSITAGISLTESLVWLFNAGISNFAFYFNMEPGSFQIDINIIALAIIIWIEKIKKKASAEIELEKIASIGEL